MMMLGRLTGLLVGALLAAPASAADKIQYYECRADNDETSSVFGLDETTKKVCDRNIQATWIVPRFYGRDKVVWADSISTKTIYRTHKGKLYEHGIFIFVHGGRCSHLKVPPAQTCNG